MISEVDTALRLSQISQGEGFIEVLYRAFLYKKRLLDPPRLLIFDEDFCYGEGL